MESKLEFTVWTGRHPDVLPKVLQISPRRTDREPRLTSGGEENLKVSITLISRLG